MAVAVRNMVGNLLLPGANGVLFTTSAGATDVVRGAVLCALTAATVTLHKVPSGVSASVSTTLLSGLALSAGASRVISELLNQVFAAGDSLQGFASLSAAVTINVGGARVT